MRAHSKRAAAAPKAAGTRQLSGQLIMPGDDGGFVQHLVSQVEQATSLIVISSYLIQNGPLIDAVLKKADDGVFVALLTASSEDLESRTDDELSAFEQSVLDEHAALLDRIAGRILVRTSPQYHAKFLAIDPASETACGTLMTCNMTEDAMNGRNIEAAVVLSPADVRSVFSLFLHGFWQTARHELFAAGLLSPAASAPDMALGTVTLPATYEKVSTLKETVAGVIAAAQERLDISCWTFLHPDIAKQLCARAKEGIAVNLYVHIPETVPPVFDTLAAAGVRIFGHPRMHLKTVTADRRYGLIMTANISEFGMDTGFEAGISIDDPSALETLAAEISAQCTQPYIRTTGTFAGMPGAKTQPAAKEPAEPEQHEEPSAGKPQSDVLTSVLNSYLSERRKELKKE